jgi:hypothetical protein
MSKRYPGNYITGNPVALSQTSNAGVWDLKDQYQATGNDTWQEVDGIYEIGRSLRFRASAPAYLSRTPQTQGSTTTFTWSGWIKRSRLYATVGTYQTIFAAGGSGGNEGIWWDGSSDGWYSCTGNSGSNAAVSNVSSQQFRDVAGWYHLVYVYDSSNAVSSERMRMYINGTRITSFSTVTYPSLNQSTYFNNPSYQMRLGYHNSNAYPFDGYMAEVNYVDGQALDASYFGYTDSITGIWQPKRYTGNYGVNGFYLPFKDIGNLYGLGCDRKPTTSLGTYLSGTPFTNTPNKWGTTALTLTGGNYIFPGGLGSGYGIHYDEHYIDGKDFTIEFWYKGQASDTNFGSQDGILTGYNYLMSKGRTNTSSNGYGVRLYSNGGIAFEIFGASGANSGGVGWTGGGAYPTVLDNAWHHIAISRAGGTVRVFCDGTQQASGTLNFSCNNTYGVSINGMWDYTNGNTLTYKVGGTMDDFRMYTGIAKYTSSFSAPNAALAIGELDPYWGYVSCALTMDVVSPTTASKDQLAFYKGNVWNPNNLSVTAGTTYDSMVDSPTNVFTSATDVGGVVSGNYATLNPLEGAFGNITISNAGLTLTSSGNSGYHNCGATISPEGNKGYFEVTCTNSPNGHIGVSAANPNYLNYAGSSGDAVYLGTDGSVYNIYTSTIKSGSITAPSSGDVIMVAFDFTDAANKKLWFGRQGTWGLDASSNTGNPAAGTNATVTSTNLLSTKNYRWYFGLNNGAAYAFNFGQRAFAYTPPTGFGSLNTTNMQARGIAAVGKAAIQPNNWFDVVLSTGSTIPRTVSGLGFQPDMILMKNRAGDTNRRWGIYDSVRGPNSHLSTQGTGSTGFAAEVNSQTDLVTSFNSDGFSVGADAGLYGANGYNERWWQGVWKQSPTAGFNIVSYTGDGTNNKSISHNLGVSPSMIWIHNRDATGNWVVEHVAIPDGRILLLNDAQNQSGQFLSEFRFYNRTSSNFQVGNPSGGSNTNVSGNKYIAYLWADVPGFSKFGSYTGNGSSDGTFVYTGFTPKYIMTKDIVTAANNWGIFDIKRNPNNGVSTNLLRPNIYDAEYNNGDVRVDFLSNGFKLRAPNNLPNESVTYMYAAFAESPFALNNRAR